MPKKTASSRKGALSLLINSVGSFEYIITNDGRVETRVTVDTNGNEFYGCEVCWTCRWFDGVSKCTYSSPREIKVSPAWFRCKIYLSMEYVEKFKEEHGL